jgi:putative spermidine/putrescine transport system substrate-binding protein
VRPTRSKTLALLGAALLLGATPAAAQSPAPVAGDWTTTYDPARVKDQAASFQTYGMPDSWANYGESIKQFCAAAGIDPCVRTEAGPDYSSLEEITHFDAEKNNPVAAMADIGIQFGPVAETQGVVPPYLPPNADVLPVGFKSPTGGWIATFAGVPGFNVNVKALTDKGVAIPTSWADLTKPEYKGLVGIGTIGQSGTATSAFIAMNIAAGGSMTDFAPGIEYGKALLPNIDGVKQGGDAEMEKGEVPIQIKYDFNLIAQATALADKGINVQTVIPADGSIYAPSALMLNGYNAGKMDLIKAFSEWVLTDEGQTVFAKFGARPVRYVLGDLTLPDEAKAKWLSDDLYAKVQTVDLTTMAIEDIKAIWESDVLGQ